ncbi:hypothetical protein ACFY3B_10605 [Micromonospora parva]|uniref:Uncharacterized protein n=1 Tax=Micromonospora parva TaxID=1464048 RepID=A0ABW6VRN6_9ACTN
MRSPARGTAMSTADPFTVAFAIGFSMPTNTVSLPAAPCTTGLPSSLPSTRALVRPSSTRRTDVTSNVPATERTVKLCCTELAPPRSRTCHCTSSVRVPPPYRKVVVTALPAKRSASRADPAFAARSLTTGPAETLVFAAVMVLPSARVRVKSPRKLIGTVAFAARLSNRVSDTVLPCTLHVLDSAALASVKLPPESDAVAAPGWTPGKTRPAASV